LCTFTAPTGLSAQILMSGRSPVRDEMLVAAGRG
jgi:hypothetical protein